jgi:hypothetical protein
MNQSTSLEEALHILEEENRKFEDHWFWRELNCRPRDFFRAFERHLGTLQIPRDKWQRALERAKEASRIRIKEKQSHQDSHPLPVIPGMRV